MKSWSVRNAPRAGRRESEEKEMNRLVVLAALLALVSSSFAVTDSQLHKDIKVDLIKTNPSVVADETEFIAYLVFTNEGSEKHEISFTVVTSSLFSHTGPGAIEYSEIILEPGESVNYEIQVYAKELVLAKNPLKLVIKEDEAAAVKSVFVTGTLEKKYIDIAMENFTVYDEDELGFVLVVDPSEDFYNVRIDFGLSSMPLQIEGDDNVKILPAISQTTYVPINMSVDDTASSQIYQIMVNTSANDAYNNEYSSVSYLPIKLEFPDKVSLGKVTSTPQNLKRDTKNNIIDVEIANQGKDEIDNVEAHLVVGAGGFDPTFFRSDYDFIGTVGSGERKSAQFKLDVDEEVESGTYQGTVYLSYYHLGEQKNRSFPVSLNVQKLPYFVVNQTTNERNENNEITFYVTNLGDECTSVEVSGLTKNLPITWKQNADKAAKLGEDETKEFKLELKFNELASAKEYGVPISIRCVYNEEPVIQEEEIAVLSKGREDNMLPVILAAGFILVLAILVGRHFFRPKREAPDASS